MQIKPMGPDKLRADRLNPHHPCSMPLRISHPQFRSDPFIAAHPLHFWVIKKFSITR